MKKWLAIPAGGDTVRLVPVEGSGPDVFVKLVDAEAAVAAERERWDALRSWVEKSRREYEAGEMMSIVESIHGAASLRDVLDKMKELDGPNA